MTTFVIATQSAPGRRTVDGIAFGQYAVYATSVHRDDGSSRIIAYYVTHLPTGRRVGFETSTFAGFSSAQSANRIAQLWAEHAPALGADLSFGDALPATEQIRAFANAVLARVAKENLNGAENCGPFAPPPLT